MAVFQLVCVSQTASALALPKKHFYFYLALFLYGVWLNKISLYFQVFFPDFDRAEWLNKVNVTNFPRSFLFLFLFSNEVKYGTYFHLHLFKKENKIGKQKQTKKFAIVFYVLVVCTWLFTHVFDFFLFLKTQIDFEASVAKRWALCAKHNFGIRTAWNT